MSAWLLHSAAALLTCDWSRTNIVASGLRRRSCRPGIPWRVMTKRALEWHHHSANAVENGLIIARNRRSAVCILSPLPLVQATNSS